MAHPRSGSSVPGVLVLVLLAAACDVGTGGQGGFTASDPTTDLARTAIEAHNQFRANASPKPSPALPAVQWSSQVEAVAAAWAANCVYKHNAARGNLGENIAADAPPGAWPTIAEVVQAWASEAQWYDYASNGCSAPPGQDCGHYTQVVWRDSTLIGCAYARCSTNSPFPGYSTWDFWVCDYSPPGNWVGERPY